MDFKGTSDRCDSDGRASKRLKTAAVIEVNCGGRIFSTTRTTLKKSGFFATMLAYEEEGKMDTTRDADGPIFVDRCPLLFEHILKYLGSWQWFIHDNEDLALRRELRCECDFFQVESPLLYAVSNEDVLEINVGGTLFTVAASTVSKSPVVQAAISETEEVLRDSRGRLFFDANPEAFGYILQFLRTNEWNPDAVPMRMRHMICDECPFWEVDAPQKTRDDWLENEGKLDTALSVINDTLQDHQRATVAATSSLVQQLQPLGQIQREISRIEDILHARR